MKFRITFKDPDGVSDSINDIAESMINFNPSLPNFIDEYERETLLEDEQNKLFAFAEKWIKYGECITIEFDTELGTATVQKADF